MKQELKDRDRTTDLGVVRINNDVITAIASIAAQEVKGMYKMGGGLGRTLFDMATRKSGAKGVKVQTTDSEVRLTVSIVVEYGVDIPRIADEVQENVKRAVEKMTGLVLSQIDVIIEGVHSQTLSDKTRTLIR